jgi:hypothetical protein
MAISAKFREFAAMPNARVREERRSVDEAESGMAEMSKRSRDEGSDLYLPVRD